MQDFFNVIEKIIERHQNGYLADDEAMQQILSEAFQTCVALDIKIGVADHD